MLGEAPEIAQHRARGPMHDARPDRGWACRLELLAAVIEEGTDPMQPNQPIPVTEPDVVHPPTPIEEPQPDKGPDLPQPGPDVVVPPGPEVITPPQPQEIPPERPAEYRRR
jgi:hypothetical protein